MIKVSTESWHYRLLEARGVFDTEPKTLCSYFWSVVFAPFLITFMWTIMTTAWLFGVDELPSGNPKVMHRSAFWIMLATVIIGVYLVIPYVFLYSITTDYFYLLMVLSVVIEVLCLWGLVAIWRKYLKAHPSLPKEGESFLSLTWKTIKAGKRKVCPLIKYIY